MTPHDKRLSLARLQRLLDERRIMLELDEAAKAWLADQGYDPVYGARPLKRVSPGHDSASELTHRSLVESAKSPARA